MKSLHCHRDWWNQELRQLHKPETSVDRKITIFTQSAAQLLFFSLLFFFSFFQVIFVFFKWTINFQISRTYHILFPFAAEVTSLSDSTLLQTKNAKQIKISNTVFFLIIKELVFNKYPEEVWSFCLCLCSFYSANVKLLCTD